MIGKLNIREVFMAGLMAVATAALIALYAGPASAGPREDNMSRLFCQNTAKGDKGKFKQCIAREEKAKGGLNGRAIAKDVEKYCKRSTGGSYFLFEKCASSVENSRAKMKKPERKAPPRRKSPADTKRPKR